jgi:hypothetical protein
MSIQIRGAIFVRMVEKMKTAVKLLAEIGLQSIIRG